MVSEETGSISLAEKGKLDRPLTGSKLKELLENKLDSKYVEPVPSNIGRWSRQVGSIGKNAFQRFFRLPSSTSTHKK